MKSVSQRYILQLPGKSRQRIVIVIQIAYNDNTCNERIAGLRMSALKSSQN